MLTVYAFNSEKPDSLKNAVPSLAGKRGSDFVYAGRSKVEVNTVGRIAWQL